MSIYDGVVRYQEVLAASQRRDCSPLASSQRRRCDILREYSFVVGHNASRYLGLRVAERYVSTSFELRQALQRWVTMITQPERLRQVSIL